MNLNSAKSSLIWQDLQQHQFGFKNINLLNLFNTDSKRYKKMHCKCNGITLDFSKNLMTDETLSLLIDLAKAQSLKKEINELFQGKQVNFTEKRAALHTLLRNSDNTSSFTSLNTIKNEVKNTLKEMESLVKSVHSGLYLSTARKKITDIVNIGIGGSDLGPQMVCEALKPYHVTKLRTHFVSNVDSSNLIDILKFLNPETTLFIISSKSFTTTETLSNANSAKKWLQAHYLNEKDLSKHFIAVTANTKKAKQSKIPFKQILSIWQWVGGRFSLWSAIGLPIAFAIGYTNYQKILKGGALMDEHYQNTPFEKNMPVIMALLEVWYVNFWHTQTHAILPYDYYLRLFPKYLQQLTMESNGKRVNKNGQKTTYATAPVLWGESGTNGQHSYHQLLHQGTQMIPVDFILPLESLNPLDTHQQQLISHCLSQSRALMLGKNLDQVKKELQQEGLSSKEISSLAHHKTLPGNRPSNTFILEKLTPSSLGSLIAAYEHKVYTQSIIWNINAFDQWGVEIGKQMSHEILKEILENKNHASFDGSTEALVSLVKKTYLK